MIRGEGELGSAPGPGDLVIDAQASARELRFRAASRVEVEHWALPRLGGGCEVTRQHLPEEVQIGNRYRDVAVRFQLVTRLLRRHSSG